MREVTRTYYDEPNFANIQPNFTQDQFKNQSS